MLEARYPDLDTEGRLVVCCRMAGDATLPWWATGLWARRGELLCQAASPGSPILWTKNDYAGLGVDDWQRHLRDWGDRLPHLSAAHRAVVVTNVELLHRHLRRAFYRGTLRAKEQANAA